MARSADIAIVCAGLSSFLEGEEGESLLSPMNGDRDNISLPQSQINYIKELSIHGVKIVLVLTGGSPIVLGEVEEMVDAILFAWYPGMEGAREGGAGSQRKFKKKNFVSPCTLRGKKFCAKSKGVFHD